jgi:drug/metabolite transporter (DMT)-like permease
MRQHPHHRPVFSPARADNHRFQRGDPKAAELFALAGLLFPAAVTLMNYGATRRIGPNLTGALGNLAPLCAVFIAFILLGETPRAGQLAAIAVILFGVALLFGNPFGRGAKAIDWAVSLPLLAAIIRGLVQPVVKLGLAAWPNPFAATLFAYVVSAAVLTSAGLLREGPRALSLPRGAAGFGSPSSASVTGWGCC